MTVRPRRCKVAQALLWDQIGAEVINQCGIKWKGIKNGSGEQVGVLVALEQGHPDALAQAVRTLAKHDEAGEVDNFQLDAKLEF